MILQSSVVIFQALEPFQPQWPLQPQQSQWPQWPHQPHFIKKIAELDISINLFCSVNVEWIIKKITILLISHPFFWRLGRTEVLLLTKAKGYESKFCCSGFPKYLQTQFLSALFIILVGLMVTLSCEKMLISTRCIHGFMSNLIKKSWTDSTLRATYI